MGIQTSGGEIIGILKKIKDANPADSHHAPEWKERQKNGRTREADFCCGGPLHNG